MHKRAQGRKRLGKKNFKKRWLRVTNRELSYHKHKGETSFCRALFSMFIIIIYFNSSMQNLKCRVGTNWKELQIYKRRRKLNFIFSNSITQLLANLYASVHFLIFNVTSSIKWWYSACRLRGCKVSSSFYILTNAPFCCLPWFIFLHNTTSTVHWSSCYIV